MDPASNSEIVIDHIAHAFSESHYVDEAINNTVNKLEKKVIPTIEAWKELKVNLDYYTHEIEHFNKLSSEFDTFWKELKLDTTTDVEKKSAAEKSRLKTYTRINDLAEKNLKEKSPENTDIQLNIDFIENRKYYGSYLHITRSIRFTATVIKNTAVNNEILINNLARAFAESHYVDEAIKNTANMLEKETIATIKAWKELKVSLDYYTHKINPSYRLTKDFDKFWEKLKLSETTRVEKNSVARESISKTYTRIKTLAEQTFKGKKFDVQLSIDFTEGYESTELFDSKESDKPYDNDDRYIEKYIRFTATVIKNPVENNEILINNLAHAFSKSKYVNNAIDSTVNDLEKEIIPTIIDWKELKVNLDQYAHKIPPSYKLTKDFDKFCKKLKLSKTTRVEIHSTARECFLQTYKRISTLAEKALNKKAPENTMIQLNIDFMKGYESSRVIYSRHANFDWNYRGESLENYIRFNATVKMDPVGNNEIVNNNLECAFARSHYVDEAIKSTVNMLEEKIIPTINAWKELEVNLDHYAYKLTPSCKLTKDFDKFWKKLKLSETTLEEPNRPARRSISETYTRIKTLAEKKLKEKNPDIQLNIDFTEGYESTKHFDSKRSYRTYDNGDKYIEEYIRFTATVVKNPVEDNKIVINELGRAFAESHYVDEAIKSTVKDLEKEIIPTINAWKNVNLNLDHYTHQITASYRPVVDFGSFWNKLSLGKTTRLEVNSTARESISKTYSRINTLAVDELNSKAPENTVIQLKIDFMKGYESVKEFCSSDYAVTSEPSGDIEKYIRFTATVIQTQHIKG